MKEQFVWPVIDLEKTGENIRDLRERNGMSVKDLQEVFGFTSPQAIYKWQWGQTLPDVANLLVMTRLWNVRVEDILVLAHQDVSFFGHGHRTCGTMCRCVQTESPGSLCIPHGIRHGIRKRTAAGVNPPRKSLGRDTAFSDIISL